MTRNLFLVGSMLAAGFAVSGCFAAPPPSGGVTCDDSPPDDGVSCTVAVCDGDTWRQSRDNGLCDDGEVCDLDDGCVPAGSTPDCNDGVACTADSYDGSECVNDPIHARCPDGQRCGSDGCYTPPTMEECETAEDCNDGVACTANLCASGECRYAADDSACPSDQHCSATAGCVDDTPPECDSNADCNDGVSCTSDSCVSGECRNVADDAMCPSDQRCSATAGCVDDTPPTGDFECSFIDGANRIGYSVRLCTRGMTGVRTIPDVDGATQSMSGSATSMRAWGLGPDVPAGDCRDYDLAGITGGINTHPFIREWRVDTTGGHPEWDRDILNVADFRGRVGDSAASVGLEAYVCQRAAGCSASQWVELPEAFYRIALDTVGARFWSEDPNLHTSIRGTVAVRAVLQTSCEAGHPPAS